MEIFVLCLLAYFLVSPDKGSLAFSRGVAGAGYGALTGRTPKAAKDSKASPRGRAMLAGWKEGVAAARERREAGRDLWSRGTRVAGRVGGGTGSLVRGINGTIQARRGQTDDTPGTGGDASPDAPGLDGSASPDAVPSRRGWTFPRLVRRPRTAPTSDASGLVVDQDGNDVKDSATSREPQEPPEAATEPASKDEIPAQDAQPTPAPEPTPSADGSEPERPNAIPTTRTAANGDITMPKQTELSTLDELASELKAMENAFTDLTELVARVKKWGAGLPDRWSATNWGTKGIDRAITDISEEIAGIKLVTLESFANARGEIVKARTLGETADAVQARGQTEAFRSN